MVTWLPCGVRFRYPPALGYGQGRAMDAAPVHDVIDPPAGVQRHIPVADQNVVRAEGVAGFLLMLNGPGVLLSDADSFQRLQTGPEPDAGGVRCGVEVSGDYDMAVCAVQQSFHRACCRHCL